MKRFLVFAGYCHEASGGWDDLRQTGDTLDAARAWARLWDKENIGADIWWHIVDTGTGEIALADHQDPGTPSTEKMLKKRLGVYD